MRLVLALVVLAGCPHSRAPETAVIEAAGPRAPLDPAVRAALEAGAADLDVGVRRRAIDALIGADPAPGGGVWGGRGRYDPSEYVRRATMEALGARAAEPESRALLRGAVEDTALDPFTRGAAALALVSAARAGRVPAGEVKDDAARISQAAAGATNGRAAALLLAAAEAGDNAARGRLVDLISAGNLPLELWIFRAIGASGEQALVPPLTRAQDLVEPEIRLAVATALAELGSPAGVNALGAALSSGDEDTAFEALEYLADTPAEAAVSVLRGARDGGGPLRSYALLALFGRGEGDLRAVLDVLGGDDADLRAAAAVAAGRRLRREPGMDGGDRLRTALVALLPDDDVRLQLAAADALAGTSRAADRQALLNQLGDESVQVRIAAAVALALPPRP